MNIRIVHLGGTEKVCEFDGFDGPRPWARLRYPNGGGVWAFALAHGGIEAKRGTLPEWRIAEVDLAMLRAEGRAAGLHFATVPFARGKAARPVKPRKAPPQKQLELFK